MNTYHRHLKVPVPFTFDFNLARTAHHTRYSIDTQTDEFRAWLNSFGCEAYACEAFCNPTVKPHVDGVLFDNHVKLLFTHATGKHEMRWFEPHDASMAVPFRTDIDTYAVKVEREHCKLLHTANLFRPSLVNVGMLHDVKANAGVDLIIWCVILQPIGEKRLVAFDEALVLLKDYII